MIFFTDRKKLEDKYNKWIKENPIVKDCSFNVITFLEPLLDEEKVKEFLEKEEKKAIEQFKYMTENGCEKCIYEDNKTCVNCFDDHREILLNLIEKQQKELEKKNREIQIKNNYLDLIWQIGYDYDGLNKVESLKELIDELVDYAIKAKKNDDKSVIYEGQRGKEIINQNILFEKVDEING